MKKLFVATLTAAMMSSSAYAQDINPPADAYEAPKKEYSPFVDDHFPTRILWGDTHLHTSWSVDAGFLGATLGPEGAYRASMGQAVTAKSGFEFKLYGHWISWWLPITRRVLACWISSRARTHWFCRIRWANSCTI